jgi:hypothetical protein
MTWATFQEKLGNEMTAIAWLQAQHNQKIMFVEHVTTDEHKHNVLVKLLNQDDSVLKHEETSCYHKSQEGVDFRTRAYTDFITKVWFKREHE